MDTALHEVSNLMKRSMGAERCEVILADSFGKLRELGFPESIAKSAIEQRSAIVIPDMALLADQEAGRSALLYRIRSALCVPVLSGDEVLALIYMYKTDPTAPAFDQRDMQLAVAISHQAALTIQRTRLIADLQNQQQMQHLLRRFLSPQEADFLLKDYLEHGNLPELKEQTVTVLFADIEESTSLAENLGAERFGKLLARFYQEITKIINVTPLLNHNLAGVSGNLYSLAIGSVDNVVRFDSDPERLATAIPGDHSRCLAPHEEAYSAWRSSQWCLAPSINRAAVQMWHCLEPNPSVKGSHM